MNTLCYTLATAGHIDHGKSALVLALTGTEPDRLPEEKTRGLTIELGFAHFSLPMPPFLRQAPDVPAGANRDAVQSAVLDIGIIDVPGHEDFVKNMVAGVGSIDAALLVVAADDGWMPQTEEHLQILMHLGVSRGVVALTKSDLVEHTDVAIAAVRDRLRGTFLASSPIVPTSLPAGRGLGELNSALAQVLAAAPPQRDLGRPRLAVDRAFSLKGVGTVVTGTLTGGVFKSGQSVVVQPNSATCRIRTIHTNGQAIDVGRPGSRVALNLPDLAISADHGGRAAGVVSRGDMITIPALGGPTRMVDVTLRQLGRGTERPMRDGVRVWLHHGSGAAAGKLRLLKTTGPGPTLARLKLATPIFALTGDRFVVRDWSGRHTLTGGAILDVDPQPIRKQMALLEARAAAPADASAFVLSQLARDGAVVRKNLLVRSRFDAGEVERSAQHLIDDGNAVQHGPLLFLADAWAALIDAAALAVDAFHRAHPERSGLPLVDLHHALEQRRLSVGAADAVIAAMCQDGFVRRGPAVARSDHRPALPPRLAAGGERLRAALREHPFDPPSRNQLVRDDASAQALRFLIAAGEAIEISTDVILSADAYTRAANRVRDAIRKNGPATVSQLKSLLACSRRVMVPLLEHFDRDGITRRQGDERVLRE